MGIRTDIMYVSCMMSELLGFRIWSGFWQMSNMATSNMQCQNIMSLLPPLLDIHAKDYAIPCDPTVETGDLYNVSLPHSLCNTIGCGTWEKDGGAGGPCDRTWFNCTEAYGVILDEEADRTCFSCRNVGLIEVEGHAQSCQGQEIRLILTVDRVGGI